MHEEVKKESTCRFWRFWQWSTFISYRWIHEAEEMTHVVGPWRAILRNQRPDKWLMAAWRQIDKLYRPSARQASTGSLLRVLHIDFGNETLMDNPILAKQTCLVSVGLSSSILQKHTFRCLRMKWKMVWSYKKPSNDPILDHPGTISQPIFMFLDRGLMLIKLPSDQNYRFTVYMHITYLHYNILNL